MSKIFSTPKMPAIPLIQYTPVERTPSTVDTPVVQDTPDISADEQRLNTLLNRRRGRMGTIGTSLRGVFHETATDTNTAPQRKTLLGE